MGVTRCRSCHARIVWTRTDSRNRRMPVDFERVPDGTIEIVFEHLYEEPRSFVLTKQQLADRRRLQRESFEQGIVDTPELSLYRSHFATCPHSKRWRERRKQAA